MAATSFVPAKLAEPVEQAAFHARLWRIRILACQQIKCLRDGEYPDNHDDQIEAGIEIFVLKCIAVYSFQRLPSDQRDQEPDAEQKRSNNHRLTMCDRSAAMKISRWPNSAPRSRR